MKQSDQLRFRGMGILCALFIFIIALSFAGKASAQKIIQGFISDADTGEYLPVAHIRVAGTRTGTVSNDSGEYNLEITDLPAKILVSYIGYNTESVAVTTDTPDTVNIALDPSPVILETIVVSGADRATRIMKEVIRKKQEWRPSMKTFRANAYTRVNLANDKKIASIGESLSSLYWDTDEGVKEVIKSKRQTKNMKMSDNFANARMMPNLYDDDIEILGFQVIGPTHPDALKYYEFKILERQFMDDKTVYVMSLTPKSKLQPLLVGTISVLDEVYGMIALDVTPNDAIRFPPPMNKFNFAIEQSYSNFDEEFWLPVDVRIKGDFKIKLPGLEFPLIKYSQFTRLSDFEINVALPDSLFVKKDGQISVGVSNESVSVSAETGGDAGDETAATEPVEIADQTNNENTQEMKFHRSDNNAASSALGSSNTEPDEPQVNDSEQSAAQSPAASLTDSLTAAAAKDSLFAINREAIPFTENEKDAYSTIDSTMTMEKAFKPKGALTKLFKDDKEKKKKKKEQSAFGKVVSKALDGFSPQLWHNRVDAFNLGAKYEKKYKKKLTAGLKGSYKTGQERWAYGGSLKYTLGEKNRGYVEMSAETGTDSQYQSSAYPMWFNSILTLGTKDDYFDYFRNDKISVRTGYWFRKPNIAVSGGINIEHHESLQSATDRNLTGVFKNPDINPPIDKGQLRSLDVMFKYRQSYSPFAVDGVKGGHIRIEHSAPGILSSDFTFTRIHADLNWRFKTFLKRRLFPMALDMRLVGGTSTGRLPVQRYGALDGAFMALTPYGTFRSMTNRPIEGEHYGALYYEHNFRTVPFEIIGLNILADKGLGVIFHGASGRTWISRNSLDRMPFSPRYHDGMINEVGFSLNTIYTLFRIDVTKRLENGDWTVGFGMARIM